VAAAASVDTCRPRTETTALEGAVGGVDREFAVLLDQRPEFRVVAEGAVVLRPRAGEAAGGLYAVRPASRKPASAATAPYAAGETLFTRYGPTSLIASASANGAPTLVAVISG